MEVRATRQLRRNEQLDRLRSRKADTQEAPSGARGAQQKTDRCAVSRQALEYLERQNMIRQELEQRRAAQESRIRAQLSEMESKEKQLDLLAKAMDVMKKCMKIAASIMKGNKVPPEDLKYLMENDPDGYRLAMALRRENPDPKREKSVLDDEDRNGRSAASETEGAADAAATLPDAGPGQAAH